MPDAAVSGHGAPNGRFVAYLLCPELPVIGLEALRRSIAMTFPRFAQGLMPLSLPDLERSGFAFVLAGVPMTCILVPAQLPRTEWEPGTQANPAWPQAGDVARATGAHVIVAPLAEVADRMDGLRKAVACSIVAAALMPPAGAEGLCWYPAQTLIQPRSFINMVQSLAAQAELGSLPLDAWMRLAFGRMEGRYAAIGRGLVPLLGHDLMVVADAPDPAGQGAILHNVAGYLIREGRSFADGDTMDVGAARLIARHAEGAPMVRLEMMGRDG